ncbi:MAG: M20 family metallopeptidase [Euryarchaeota archaeon]|nr:M20 family metallopeptidase [Euryarchaeota archaeon]
MISKPRVKRRLRELLALRSESGSEGEVRELLKAWLEEAGMETEVDEQGNLIATVKRTHKRVVLNGHLDTVPGYYGVTEEGDVLCARGAVDMKAGLAGIVEAMHALAGEELRYSPEVHFVVGEETAKASGSAALAGRCRASFAIVAEPTSLALHLGQRGRVTISVAVRGRAAHASRAELGVNAIYRAIDAIERLRLLPMAEHPQLGSAGLEVTEISAGVAPNVVPEVCTFTIDRRLTLGETPEQALRQVHRALAGLEYEAKLVNGEYSKPFLLEREHPFVKALAEAISRHRELRYGVSRATTDASYYHSAGIPAVIFGPGKPELAHTREERIDINEVVEFSSILVDFLRQR